MFSTVGRPSKSHQPLALIRQVVAFNVEALRDRKFETLPTVTARNKELAKRAGTTLSQIQRVISKDLGTSVDLIERLATALECRPQDLLEPYFAYTQNAKAPRLAESLQRSPSRKAAS
jgi:DNA-binding Xre family transcriptional regulator